MAVLAKPTRAFDLPAEREAAEQVERSFLASMERIGQIRGGSKQAASAAELALSRTPLGLPVGPDREHVEWVDAHEVNRVRAKL
ncbi:hypothetical protein ACFYWY_37440, partial [Streptomyces sp. NPDC002870]